MPKYMLTSLIVATINSLAWGRFAAREPTWTFDIASAVIGFVVGALVSLTLYLLRQRLVRLRNTVTSRVSDAKDRLSTGVEDRYREHIINLAEHAHILKHYAPLAQIYVEPHLTVPPIHSRTILDDDQEQDVERWHDERLYDILYPRQTPISLGAALKQSNRLAILGPVGSGRTTALLRLACQFARREGWQLTVSPPQETDTPEVAASRSRERERLPIWVPLESLDLATRQEDGRHVLIKPITDYLSSSLPRLIAAASMATVRTRLLKGQCLLLCDNLDMLDEAASQQAIAWLNDLSHAYPGNIMIVTGAQEGYGALLDNGFGPLMLDGFQRSQVSQFVERWQALREELVLKGWETQVAAARANLEAEREKARREGRPLPGEADMGLPEAPIPAPSLLSLWPAGRRDLVLPLDLALAAMLWRERDDIPSARLMRFAQAVVIAMNRTQNSLLSPPHWGRVLGGVAWTLHGEGRHEARRDEFEKPIAELLAQSMQPAQPAQEGQSQPEMPDWAKLARTALNALLKTGDLLVDVGRGRVAFAHPSFRAYFAAQHAARSGQAGQLVDHVQDVRWQETILFYAALSSVSPLVVERIKGPDDVLRTNFFTAAEYLITSPEADKKLLGGVLAELSQIILNPRQPIALRRRAANAVANAESRGATYLFNQAIKSADPHVRALGIWGLGQMGDERATAGLMQATADPDRLVRMQALHALSRRGGAQVVDGLVHGLQDEDDLVRRVAAEALGSLGEEGHRILQGAVKSQDMYIRRAALYGLHRAGEPWAIEILDRLSREDKEWFVRSAALGVMEKVRGAAPEVLPQRQLAEEAWLASWKARRGGGLSVGGAEEALSEALREGDRAIQMAAADTLRACGTAQAVLSLQAALASDDLLLRDAAYAALCEISRRTATRVFVQKLA